VEPSLTFLDNTASADFKQVSVYSNAAGTWSAASLSKSGTCYWIKDASGAGGKTTYDTGATCTGQAADAAVDLAW